MFATGLLAFYVSFYFFRETKFLEKKGTKKFLHRSVRFSKSFLLSPNLYFLAEILAAYNWLRKEMKIMKI